jgi:hypothetical protein
LFSEVPLQFLAFQATKHAFFSGSSLKTEVFRDVLWVKINPKIVFDTYRQAFMVFGKICP